MPSASVTEMVGLKHLEDGQQSHRGKKKSKNWESANKKSDKLSVH